MGLAGELSWYSSLLAGVGLWSLLMPGYVGKHALAGGKSDQGILERLS